MSNRKSAIISSCGKFRYHLVRHWDEAKKPLPFIMLNPSTADAEEDDPTIRKCMGFARRLDYGGIEVFNLFAYRTKKPADLRKFGFQVGPRNDSIFTGRLQELGAHERGIVICAWGANVRGVASYRASEILSWLALAGCQLRALRLLSDGIPEHPLMLPYSCTPISLHAKEGQPNGQG